MEQSRKKVVTQFKVDRAKHSRKIDNIIKNIECFLQSLTKDKKDTKKLLITFKQIVNTYDNRFQKCNLRYECAIPYLTDHNVELSFFIFLQADGRSVMETRTTSCKTRFHLSPCFDVVILQRMIIKRVEQWIKGAKSEKLFFEEFLVHLPLKHPKRISRVYRSGQQADKKLGFDFVVCFYSMITWKEVKVRINLKSSAIFLESHKKKYPDISTFIFKPWQLQKMQILERRFLNFLVRAQYSPQHF